MMKNKKFIFFSILIFTFLSFSHSSFADTLACKIVGITDGDTVSALCSDNQLIKIRLANIDAPEAK